MALDSETKLFSTLRALDHVLSVQSRAHCPAGPECAQIPKVVCKCPELKGFGFFFFFFFQPEISTMYWIENCLETGLCEKQLRWEESEGPGEPALGMRLYLFLVPPA